MSIIPRIQASTASNITASIRSFNLKVMYSGLYVYLTSLPNLSAPLHICLWSSVERRSEKGKMSEREGPKEGNIKDLGKQGKLRIRHRRGLMLRFTHISCFYWWCQIHFCLSPAPHSLRITRKKPRNTNYYRLESQYYSRPLPPDTICLQVAASFRSLGRRSRCG